MITDIYKQVIELVLPKEIVSYFELVKEDMYPGLLVVLSAIFANLSPRLKCMQVCEDSSFGMH